jgi:hypothetical protein
MTEHMLAVVRERLNVWNEIAAAGEVSAHLIGGQPDAQAYHLAQRTEAQQHFLDSHGHPALRRQGSSHRPYVPRAVMIDQVRRLIMFALRSEIVLRLVYSKGWSPSRTRSRHSCSPWTPGTRWHSQFCARMSEVAAAVTAVDAGVGGDFSPVCATPGW